MPVNRRELILSAGGVVLATSLVRAAPLLDSPAFAQMRARQNDWLDKAQSLIPTLTEAHQAAVSLARPSADDSLPLRFRMDREAPAAELENRLLNKGDSFILDFEGHRTGYLSFDLVGEGKGVDAPVRLRLTFGEVPTDVAEPLYPYKGQLATGWLPDEIVNIDYLPQSVRLARRHAFRYVKIEVIDTSSTFSVRFRNVRATAVTSANSVPRPLASGDELFDRIDSVGLATLRDCMQTVFEDGPRRDQRLWVGDLRLQALSAYASFGGHALVKRCLYLFAAFPRVDDGLMGACVYEKPTPHYGGIHILDYAALFNVALFDYVRSSGDTATGDDLWPAALRQVEILSKYINSDGLFVDPKNIWLFIDWNTQLDRTAAIQGVLIYAFEQTLALASLLRREHEISHLASLVPRMRSAARSRLGPNGRVGGNSSYFPPKWLDLTLVWRKIVMVASGFVGRVQELTQLREFMAQPESGLAVIYGRRRVGKTRLIAELLEATPVLLFEGLEERPTRDQINHFLFQLQPYVESLKFRGKRPSTWKEALLLLHEALKGSPRPVVLDEFQWMANYRHELVSDLKYVWENFLAKLPGQKLILCGSIASFMLEKVINSRALYGRVDVRLSLPGFRLRESQELLADKGEAEVLEAHLLTGGIPKYLKLLGEGPSVQLAIQKHAFTPNSYFVTEYRSIFASHFGKNPDFQNIVRALAAHPLGLSREQLIEKAKLDSGGYLTEQLRDLESVGFIRAAAPIHKAAKGVQVKYFLVDAYLRFYFDFLLPNLNKIQSGRENLFAHVAQSGAFHAWMGRAFEYTCIQHAHLISTLLGFSGIDYTVGPYFVPSRKGELQGVQIDLVFDRPDNVMTACEIKYGSRPVGVEVIPEMERKVQLLEAVAGRKTIHKVLIVKEPVSQELARRMYFYRIIRADELFQ